VRIPVTKEDISVTARFTRVMCRGGGAYWIEDASVPGKAYASVRFQEGPVAQTGRNGAFVEDLLVICLHRLEGFQAGDTPDPRNDAAIGCLRQALAFLAQRTADRQARKVEGSRRP
jgi:hypothetical protein